MDCGQNCSSKGHADFKKCPAVTETRLNGIHGGMNAGRACWVMNGTLGRGGCDGRVQGLVVEKLGKCMMCDFYKFVRSEEDELFLPADLIDIVLANQYHS